MNARTPRPSSARELWALACQRRLAQAITELSFEGLIEPEPEPEPETTRDPVAGGGPPPSHSLTLEGGVRYRFRGRPSAWGGVHVELGSVERRPTDGDWSRADSLIEFLLDARAELATTTEVLSEWFEEIHNSLLAEVGQCEAMTARGAEDLASLDAVSLEGVLDGHPKLIAHRGRVGWGTEELRAYAPEFAPEFEIDWLLVARERVELSAGAEDLRSLVAESCDPQAHEQLITRARVRAPELVDEGVFVPVHPWQWRRCIASQYGRLLGTGEMVYLGSCGDRYAPRLSVRTLSNRARPGRADLKLALTILNTSCWRGLPGAHVQGGAAIGAAMGALVAADPELAGVRVLGDRGGVHVPHPDFEALGAAPYRVRELLGAIWRTSADSRLGPGEVEVPAAALHQRDLAGVPLIAAWIEASGASLEAWLDALFECTARPLYHLLCAHGLGTIAHGQNLGLVLRGGAPTGIFLRDFHGDLRRSEEDCVAPPAFAALPQRPDEHLLHDLYTGYFVSVLRFVAPVLETTFGLPEPRFLARLGACLRRYQDAHPELAARSQRFDLFQPSMVRICLNRARIRPRGSHGDGERRPLPALGPPLDNPLARVAAGLRNSHRTATPPSQSETA